MNASPQRGGQYDAVGFDLLTALIDSWSLWIAVAEDQALGRAWRRASLRLVTSAGTYRPYEAIVAEAAREVGLPVGAEHELLRRWVSGELRPWPEAPSVLAQLSDAGWPVFVVTNCSQRLAECAAAATGHEFDQIVSAERAGVYKTDPRAYRAGLAAMNLSDHPQRVLFVAGSAHDVPGAGAVGMPVYWSNRFEDEMPKGAAQPIRNAADLLGLPEILAAGRGDFQRR